MKRWRRFIQGAPLFLPLVAVVGAIGGGGGWGISAVAFLLAAAGRAWRVGLCALLCATAAGLHSRMRDERADAFRALAETEELVQLCGTVERELQRGCVLNTGWNGVRVVLRGSVPFRTGDLVQVRAIWREPSPASLPGVFDAVAWMQGQGIAASVDFVEGRKLGKPLSLRTLQSWGFYVRERLARRLMPPGTESDSSRQVLCALVLGDKGSAEFETMEGFRNGGCLHAFAVSGLHVGLVSGILWCLLRMLRVRPVVIRPLLLVCVGAYVLMTGCAVPALRAYLMLVVLLAGYMLQRRVNLLNTWSFAALLILMVEPSQLYNAGFLLSFGVYAALCIGLRLCLADSPWSGPDSYIPPSLRSLWEIRWSRAELAVRGAVIVSLSAWLFSVPITLCFFHTANSSSFLTNIAITPILPVVMLFGLLSICLAGVPLLGEATAWLAQKSAAILLAVVAWFGDLPYAYLPASPPASEHSLLVQGTGFGNSFTMLGNHGLLINCGNMTTAEIKTLPALFHSGFTPAVLLVTSSRASDGGGTAVLKRMWPELEVLQAGMLPPEGRCFETQAGRFLIYPGAAGAAPVVIWENPTGRVLYLGDAPYSALSGIAGLPVSRVILGAHPRQPIGVGDVVASEYILLPRARSDEPCLRVSEHGHLLLRLSEQK